MMFKFALGDTVRDKISGFEGVVLGRTEYLTKCIHYGLCSRELQNGKPVDWEWFDETRLFQVRSIPNIAQEEGVPKGGPCSNPPQM